MFGSRKIIASAVALLAAVVGLGAEQGMWMPQQIPDLAAKLRTLGFAGDARAFADLTGQPRGAGGADLPPHAATSKPRKNAFLFMPPDVAEIAWRVPAAPDDIAEMRGSRDRLRQLRRPGEGLVGR